MSFLAAGALSLLAKNALKAVVMPIVEETGHMAVGAAQNAIRGQMAGRMSAEEWADTVIGTVDAVKDRAVTEGGLRYVGGDIKLAPSENRPNSVTLSFQLFFLDAAEKWQKADAACDIPAARFTLETLAELETKGEIKYAVE